MIVQQSRFKLPAVIAISLGLVVFGYFITRIFAAGSTQMYINPASGSYAVGSIISVAVWINSGTDDISAVQADISYPVSMLQYVGIDDTGSALDIDTSSSGGDGTVSLDRGSSAPIHGAALVGTVKFRVLDSGSAALNFLDSSSILSSSDNANILGPTTGAAYTLGEVDATP